MSAVRPARAPDVPDMAAVLVGALGEKLRPAFGSGAERAMRGLIGADLGRDEVRYWVAEDDEGRVVGLVHLALTQTADSGFYEVVRRELGTLRASWATMVLSLLAYPRLAPDEAYVEELAVHPSARRRGLARGLLAACADEAASRGKRRLTLWVGAHNDPALALYAREGFRAVRRRRSLAARWLFAMPEAVLMERPLAAPGPAPG